MLLDRLDAIPEGDGTLLDHTLVVWGNEMGDGLTHERERVPFVLAGGGAFAGFELGRVRRFEHASHCDLLNSLLGAFGIDERFGDPRFSTGRLI